MLAFVYLPWIIAALWKAVEPGGFRWSVVAGGLLGIVFLEGGPYPFAIIAVALSVLTLANMVAVRRLHPGLILAAVVVLAVGLSAAKLFPAMTLAMQHPRATSETQFNTLDAIGPALFSPNQNPGRGSPNAWGFWEIGAYIGLFLIPAVIGLLNFRRAAPWIAATLVLFWLGRGDAGWLWPILHHAPVFASLRMPSRFLIPMVLAVGVLAGFGLQWLCDLRVSPLGYGAALVLLAACAANSMMVSLPLMRQLINFEQRPAPPAATFRQIGLGPDNNRQLIPALENHGVVHCYAYTNWPTRVAPSDGPGYRGEEYLAGSGSVSLRRWSPNLLAYRVDVPRPTVLVINQNHDSSWRLWSGRGEVFSQGDLLAVRLPAGVQDIELLYLSTPALLGLLVSAATIAIGIFMWMTPLARLSPRNSD